MSRAGCGSYEAEAEYDAKIEPAREGAAYYDGHAAGYAEAVAAIVKMFLDDAANASVMAERADRDDSPNDVEDWARERAYNETAAKKVRERFVPTGAVRRERHTAEERAVVETAMAFVAAPVFDMAVMLDLTAACAALRAKRGG